MKLSEYNMVKSLVPLAGVELIVHQDGRFLIGRRLVSPGVGKWALFGGRILKGEKLLDAVERVALSELGIKVQIEQMIGVSEAFFRKYHCVVLQYLVSPIDDSAIKLDFQHSEYKWVNSVEKLFETRAQEIVKLSGIC